MSEKKRIETDQPSAPGSGKWLALHGLSIGVDGKVRSASGKAAPKKNAKAELLQRAAVLRGVMQRANVQGNAKNAKLEPKLHATANLDKSVGTATAKRDQAQTAREGHTVDRIEAAKKAARTREAKKSGKTTGKK